MVEYLILGVFAILVPVSVAYIAGRKESFGLKEVLTFSGIGALGWIIAKIPKAAVVLPYMLANDLSLQMQENELEALLRTDFMFLLVGAVSAGVFEEACKPLGLLLIRKRLTQLSKMAVIGWIVGTGAGALEALNFIVGEAVRISLFQQGSFEASLHIPVERFLIIFQHAALTGTLVPLVFKKRYLMVLMVPVLNHTALDVVFPYLQVHDIVTNPWTIQGILLLWVVSTCLVMFLLMPGGESQPDSTRP